MKKIHFSVSRLLFALLSIAFLSSSVNAIAAPREYYQIKIYLLKSADQETRLDQFLQQAYLPALHRAGIGQVGVFKGIGNDTAAVRRVYLLIPFKTLDQWAGVEAKINEDKMFASQGAAYLDAMPTDPPYLRIESIVLKSFEGMGAHGVPDLKGAKSARIYELRSYEGPTEKKYLNKVQMFNKGDEIGLFKKLGFNAVFYAEVLSGAHMPNLMYMTSFDNMASHDEHWKNFVDDPYWKTLSALPEYQNNVSHIDIMLLHPAEYSEL